MDSIPIVAFQRKNLHGDLTCSADWRYKRATRRPAENQAGGRGVASVVWIIDYAFNDPGRPGGGGRRYSNVVFETWKAIIYRSEASGDGIRQICSYRVPRGCTAMSTKVFNFAPVKPREPVGPKNSVRFIGRSGLRLKIGVMAGLLSMLGQNRGNQGRNQA
jgi:hypothetical protein